MVVKQNDHNHFLNWLESHVTPSFPLSFLLSISSLFGPNLPTFLFPFSQQNLEDACSHSQRGYYKSKLTTKQALPPKHYPMECNFLFFIVFCFFYRISLFQVKLIKPRLLLVFQVSGTCPDLSNKPRPSDPIPVLTKNKCTMGNLLNCAKQLVWSEEM